MDLKRKLQPLSNQQQLSVQYTILQFTTRVQQRIQQQLQLAATQEELANLSSNATMTNQS